MKTIRSTLLFGLLLAPFGTAWAGAFMVTNAADSGEGTLRSALTNANASPGPHVVTFDVEGGGSRTIHLASPLPNVVRPIFVDGTTQRGYSNAPLIRLAPAPGFASSPVSLLSPGGSRLAGLALSGFTNGVAVLVGSDSNLIERCHVVSNNYGIYVGGGFWRGNRIGVPGGGNVMYGNRTRQIQVDYAFDTRIQGNLLGTFPDGLTAPFATATGIRVDFSTNTLIGGAAAGEGNVISGHKSASAGGGHGIEITFESAMNRVEGNLIGLGVDGTTVVSNQGIGIVVNGPSNRIAGNVISANDHGVAIGPPVALSTLVQSNFIGTDRTGRLARGNRRDGVNIVDAYGSLVGGLHPDQGNVIAWNNGCGIRLVLAGADPGAAQRNTFLGNRIHHNGGLPIDLGSDGVTANDGAPDADVGANGLLNYPAVTNAVQGSTFVQGYLAAASNTSYVVQFFAGGDDAEYLIGSTSLVTGATGTGLFSCVFAPTAPRGYRLAATATDALGNTSELMPLGPVVQPGVDADGDGMWDTWEAANFGGTTNGAAADLDGDFYSNYEEFIADTSPTNPAAWLRLSAIAARPQTEVSWSSSAQRVYAVDYTAALGSESFHVLASNLCGNGGVWTVRDDRAVTQYIYRVRVRVP